ncbi:hypothetical protein [Alloalcanivorax xenomutans]|uniref:hypothetical protein n=1 Tax=Alloalcanivorax xenomutans TaxID=1094342 RepID=UPI0007A73445|nr:hypothetical protein [Alloalcanivorax xenomutans]ARB46961.1 hypothetical protein P40_17315 [Alloalcanivorax xenomutans]KYZ87802.1 hypothetical protein A3Q32_10590 [Alcanivorax sp. KX64203]
MGFELTPDKHRQGGLPNRVKYVPKARDCLHTLVLDTHLPPLLKDVAQRLMAYLYWPAEVLPSLNYANGSLRQQRVERRDSCLRLLLAVLRQLDLASLRVGIPTAEGFRPVPLAVLSKKAGLGVRRRSVLSTAAKTRPASEAPDTHGFEGQVEAPPQKEKKRETPTRAAEQAWSDIGVAGLLETHQVCQFVDGEWRTFVALKTVKPEFFYALGISKRALKRARDFASQRLKKKAAQWARGNPPRSTSNYAKFLLMRNGTVFDDGKRQRHGSVGAAASPQSPPTGPPLTWADWNEETRRAYTLKCADVMIQDPTLTPDAVHRAALAWLQTR